jgi:Spy/CpxP family protein refolding chaperone
MIVKIALGVLLGAAAFRFIRRRRCRGGFGHRVSWHGFHGGRALFWLARDLKLTPEQVDQLRPLWLAGRNAVAQLRFSRMQALHGLAAAAATADPVDRARLDAVAARYAEDQAQASRDLADAIAKAHAVLNQEQREKLRQKLAWFGVGGQAPFSGGDGPYRGTAL